MILIDHLKPDALRDFPLAQPLTLRVHLIELQRGVQSVDVPPMKSIGECPKALPRCRSGDIRSGSGRPALRKDES